MILDTGIVQIFKKVTSPSGGGPPAETLEPLGEYFYGELGFETATEIQTDYQEDVEITGRIRILQDRRISPQCRVLMPDGQLYKIVRAYHGLDKDSGELISDISLSEVVVNYVVK